MTTQSSATLSEQLTKRDSSGEEILRASAVLVVDDEPGMRNFLKRALDSSCAAVEVAGSVEEAEELRKRHHFDLMVLDIRLPDISGMAWLESLRNQGDVTDVIFITAYADLEMAIKALRASASDFILKPFRLEHILAAVTRCLERRQMVRENILLRRQVDLLKPMDGVVGQSESIRKTCEIVKRVAPGSSTVLIEGETGTGKELMARAIHDLSDRRGPYVALNCGSIPPELIESELFGHVKGAFTGASSGREGLFLFARDGTLFLDEITEMPLPMQAQLLRVLEERKVRPIGAEREVPVNARVIAATNGHLADEVEAGRFRPDLFYRLEVVTLQVPPLRDRLEDIPPLVDYFVKQLAGELGVPAMGPSHEEITRFQQYDWPGNVRELRNAIERFLILGELPQDLSLAQPARTTGDDQGEPCFPLGWSLEQVERSHILAVLDSVGGNKSEAARRLGIARKTLERKLSLWQGDSGPVAAED